MLKPLSDMSGRTARPASVISPSRSRRRHLSLFSSDHTLRGRRGQSLWAVVPSGQSLCGAVYPAEAQGFLYGVDIPEGIILLRSAALDRHPAFCSRAVVLLQPCAQFRPRCYAQEIVNLHLYLYLAPMWNFTPSESVRSLPHERDVASRVSAGVSGRVRV